MPRNRTIEEMEIERIRAIEDYDRRDVAHNGSRVEIYFDRGRYPDRSMMSVRHENGQLTHTEINLRDLEAGRPLDEYAGFLAHQHSEVMMAPIINRLRMSIEIELRERFQALYGGRRAGRNYGRGPALEALRGMNDGARHMLDLMAGGMNYATGEVQKKPDKAEAIAAIADYPKQIEEVGLVAVLLDDTMKLWQESADLGHCLYRSYTPRIKAGNFIAYHVSGIKRSGYTVCFKMSSGTRVLFDPYRERKEKQWVHDQTRGKSNHTNDDPRLLSITGIILARINNVLDQKESVVTIEQTEPVPTTIINNPTLTGIIEEAASFGPEVLEMLDPLRRK